MKLLLNASAGVALSWLSRLLNGNRVEQLVALYIVLCGPATVVSAVVWSVFGCGPALIICCVLVALTLTVVFWVTR